jgi:hypothetical protein
MSRDDGFAVADLSTDLLDDPKVKALWRELDDQGRMGHALTLYTATVLASWRAGTRVTVADAAPVWLALDDELLLVLVRVRLLDHTGRLPLRSWKGWFGPAWDRREKRRRAGALGGRPPKPQLNHMDNNGKPRPADRPVRPTVRQDEARAQSANGKNGLRPIAELVTPEALIAGGRKP